MRAERSKPAPESSWPMSSAPRAASPGRRGGGRSAARRPDSIISLSEDDLKGFAGSGSLPVNEEELNAAFDFFDVEGRGRLTANDLRVRLSAFYKNLPVRAAAPRLGPHPAPPHHSRCSPTPAAKGVQDTDQRAQLHQGDAAQPAGQQRAGPIRPRQGGLQGLRSSR